MANQQEQLEILHDNQRQYSLLESQFIDIKERYEDLTSERAQEIDKILTINSKYMGMGGGGAGLVRTDSQPVLTNQFSHSVVFPERQPKGLNGSVSQINKHLRNNY